METKNSDSLHENIKEQKKEICKNSPNLSKEVVDDLEAVLGRLNSLTFQDAKQKNSFFKDVRCLQGYHVVKIFNAWAASHLQDSLKDPPKSAREIMRLFKICSQFCYSLDVSNRVSFEAFIRTVKFCFPSDSRKYHFSTKIVLMLLELLQILQEGKLTFPFLDLQKKTFCMKSATDLFNDQIAILEARDYDEDDIIKIISQASKFAQADSQQKFQSELMKASFPDSQDLQVPSDKVPAVFFRIWGDLLQLTQKGDVAFILRLASEDSLHTSLSGTMSPLCHMLNVLQELERRGEKVDLGFGKQRLDIFFGHLREIFRDGYEMTATSLKIFSCKKVKDADLAKVCKLLFSRFRELENFPAYEAQCFESIRKLLDEIPDGSLVVRVLQFWISTFPNDLEKAELKKLLDFLTGLIKQSAESENHLKEKGERLLEYLQDIFKLPLIHFWSRIPGVWEEFQRSAFSFLGCLSQQAHLSDDAKGKMVALFARCFDRTGKCDQFSCELIKSLCIYKEFSVDYRESFFKEVANFSEHLDANEKGIILAFVSKVSRATNSLVRNQEAFSELSKTSKQTRSKAFQLVMDLAKSPPPSGETDILLSCCAIVLKLASSAAAIVKEGAEEHFDLLFSAVFETLNGSKSLCEVFSIKHQKMTELHFDDGVSVNVLNIWSVVVAGLLAIGIFNDDVDSLCCLPIFARAKGFDFPFEALQLYFALRRVFSRVMLFLRDSRQSDSREPLLQGPLGNLVFALKMIVQSDLSTSAAKLRLIHKIYILVQRNPGLLIRNVLPCALMNVITFSCEIRQSRKMKHVHFDHIATIIEHPRMVEQLGNIPSTSSKLICCILCSNISGRLTIDDVVKICDCAASFGDARKVSQEHMISLLESTTKVCSAAFEVVHLLKEADEILRKVEPQLTLLAISVFSYLVENNVTAKERAAFIAQVFSIWETSCDLSICVRYAIPHILWKTYEITKNRERMYEAMDYFQEVIARVKDLETRVIIEESSANSEHGGNDLRDLERLALHSSLSCEDVALCFHLSRCYPGVRRLHCFNRYADSRARRQASLLTPATIAEIMIVQLRRLFGDDAVLYDLAVQLWNSLFTNEHSTCPDEVCKSCENSFTCNDVVNLFLSCLEKAFYFEVIPLWFDNDNRQGLSQHHIVQCSDVVTGSCGWKAKNVDKERHLMIQAAVTSILQELLGGSNQFPEMPPLPYAINCFRGLTPQLESLLCILEKGLPFQITFDLLQLARIDLQAATTIATIASLWPCKNEAGKLLEDVKRRFVKEGVRILPVYKDFVWSMLEACGRVYRDSSHVLVEKLEWLTDLHGLGVFNYGLDRLPNWRRLMTADSLPAHVIDKWCVFFLFTPRENISSRDVDAVLDLSPTSLKLVANASENIKRCLFSENGFQGTHLQEVVSSNLFIKEHLRLARLLSELIHILKPRMPEKTFIDATVEKIVVEACDKLCMSHMKKIKKEEGKIKNKTPEAEDKKQKEEDKTKTTEDKSIKEGDVVKKKKEKTERTMDKRERKSKEDKSKEIQARTEDTKDKEGKRTGGKRKQTEDNIEDCKMSKDKTKSSNPYRILHKTLEALFNEIFAKQSTIVDNQSNLPNSVEVCQGQESELGATNPVFKGSTLPQHNLPNDVYESMLVLMRRWFSGVANKPTLVSKTVKIVQSLLSFSYENDRSQMEKLPDEIRLQILSFPRNQLLLSQLQAAGYNQGDSVDSQDLWASPFLERSCFLRKSDFPSDKRYETELTNVLRLHWIQWRELLFMLNINSVKIDEGEVPTKDLFGIQASRVEMEKQVEAVKEKVGRIESENVGIRVQELIRQEQRHRARVTKLYKKKETKPCSCKGTCSKVETRSNQGCLCKTQGLECGPLCKCGSAEKPCKNKHKMEKGKKTKVVAVWENRFLENIKLCSESIPGCYAPNGFHSEKPVICALSVDNRILTVFKEEKGRREEIENVEVKLFDAGLYVYGLHSSGHDYVTDELWAAFYKMLLEKRLVPRIVLSNESPGFHWIKKFVQPVKEHPCYWKWHLHCGIVPLEEDYLDYCPIEAAMCPWLHGLSEFLTLTRINVARFRFRDFKDAKVVERKEQQAKEVARKFEANPQLELKLQSLHNDTSRRRKLASKLEFAVKKTLIQIVMGEWPTTETVKKHIDIRRLAFIKCERCKLKIQNCKCMIYQEEYATIVLRVCESVQETLLVFLFYVFLVNLYALD